jgi:hypothetical protein
VVGDEEGPVHSLDEGTNAAEVNRLHRGIVAGGEVGSISSFGRWSFRGASRAFASRLETALSQGMVERKTARDRKGKQEWEKKQILHHSESTEVLRVTHQTHASTTPSGHQERLRSLSQRAS